MIGDNIEITVVDIRGDKIRLGITAPSHIPVHRKEVYDAIQQENKQAAHVKLEDIIRRSGGQDNPAPGEPEPPASHKDMSPPLRGMES